MDHDPHWDDPYGKLKPSPPTPADEICSCDAQPPIVLQAGLKYNPIACIDCNLEVPPERLGFSVQLADDIASWRTFHDAFYHLWLDSGEFADWAREQLSDPANPVNTRGLALQSRLNEIRRCYYWWFRNPPLDWLLDREGATIEPMLNCPRCGAALAERKNRRICDPCGILVPKLGPLENL